MALPISILIVGRYRVRSNGEISEGILRRCFNYGKIIVYIISYQKQIVWIRKWLEHGSGISGRSRII